MTSKYRGVYYEADRRKWRVELTYRGTRYRLGRFDCENQAARAYNAKAAEFGMVQNVVEKE